MKIILVVVFLSYSPYTHEPITTTWRKNMRTETLCAEQVKRILKRNPDIKVWCGTPFPKGRKG
jgi:hypothetical protein